MGTDSFEVWTALPASPEEIYEAWLDESAHAAFTGVAAKIDPAVGGSFTAWDGYIAGTNRELEPGRRIVQAWRTSDFAEGDEDSVIELLLERAANGTRVMLRHSNIPAGQGARYESGWPEHYFGPMAKYFGKAKKKAAPRKKVAKKTPVKKKAAPKKTKTKKAPAKKAKKIPSRKKPARRR